MVELIPYGPIWYRFGRMGLSSKATRVPALFLLAPSFPSFIHISCVCNACIHIYIYIAGLFDTGVPSTSQFLNLFGNNREIYKPFSEHLVWQLIMIVEKHPCSHNMYVLQLYAVYNTITTPNDIKLMNCIRLTHNTSPWLFFKYSVIPYIYTE